MQLITFEGCDGVGKSTQCKQVSKYLQKKIPGDFIFTAEAKNGIFGKRVMQINNEITLTSPTQICLWYSLRTQHWFKNIAPMQKKIIIYDRFVDSTIVYQALMHNLDPQIIWSLHRQFNLPIPNLTILFIADENILLQRLKRRKRTDLYDRCKMDIIIKRQNHFLDLAHKNPQRFAIIDTGKLSHNQVTAQVMENIEKLIFNTR